MVCGVRLRGDFGFWVLHTVGVSISTSIVVSYAEYSRSTICILKNGTGIYVGLFITVWFGACSLVHWCRAQAA